MTVYSALQTITIPPDDEGEPSWPPNWPWWPDDPPEPPNPPPDPPDPPPPPPPGVDPDYQGDTFRFTHIVKSINQRLVAIGASESTLSTTDPDRLPSDGQTKSIITVLVKETTSNVPIAEKDVSFGATDGFIGGSAKTNESGVATTVFTAGFNPGITYITVNYGNTITAIDSIMITAVEARGLELFASPTQIPANGISKSTISALLRDDNFNPIIGEIIRFTTKEKCDTLRGRFGKLRIKVEGSSSAGRWFAGRRCKAAVA